MGFEDLRTGLVNTIDTLQNWTAISLTDSVKAVMNFTNFDANFLKVIMSSISAPLGIVLVVIYAFTGLIQMVQSGKEIGVEDYIRPFIVIIIVDVLLTNCGTIVGGIMSLSNAASTKMSEQLESADLTVEVMSKSPVTLDKDGKVTGLQKLGAGLLGAESVVSLIGILMTTITGFFLAQIGRVIMFVVILTAKIELLLRLGFSPIGLAGLADDGSRHAAIQYAKKMVASMLYCAAVIAATFVAVKLPGMIAVGNQISEDSALILKAMAQVSGIMTSLIAPFVAIGSAATAKAAINEAVGA